MKVKHKSIRYHLNCCLQVELSSLCLFVIFSEEEYNTAEALILTFSLNNYPRSDVKFKVVEQWESMFLDIVQEYQKDPKTKFTFAYMAEVRVWVLFIALSQS